MLDGEVSGGITGALPLPADRSMTAGCLIYCLVLRKRRGSIG
jgi:hypothetical protein